MVPNQVISAAADTSDLAAHGYAHGICSRGSAWLRFAGLKADAQRKILNLPFNGSSLFVSHTDDEMSKMKTELDTLKAVGLEKRKEFRQRFRPCDRRSFQQRVQTPHWTMQNQNQTQSRSHCHQRRPGRGRGNTRQQATAPKQPAKQ